MNEPTLHPNLAKLASAYDEILERLGHGQVSQAQARAEIAQLETRDDQGIRWSIDPDSGEWVRKTALGDVEFDRTPPTFGYMTPDAFDYTAQPQVFNPADRLSLATTNGALAQSPTGLTGATQRLTSPPTPSLAGRVRVALVAAATAVTAASRRTQFLLLAAVLALFALALHSCAGPPAGPSPASKVQVTPTPAKGAHPKVAPHPVKPVAHR